MRLERARPSSSREVGQPTTPTGIDRSATIRRTTTSCWKSFSPKNAWHGPTIENSFATTVATPAKCVGRLAPSSPSLIPPTVTVVAIGVGYISTGSGWNTRSAPASLDQRKVSGQVARIGLQVLVRRELERVHEDAHDGHVAGSGRGADQRRMTIVQVAHRRHEPDPTTGGTHLVEPRAQGGDLGDLLDAAHRRPCRAATNQSGGAVSSGSCRSCHAASASAAYVGRSIASKAARWPPTVDQSPRATGPVNAAAGPSSATPAKVPCAEREEGLHRHPERRGDALDLAEEGDEVVRRHARRGVVRRPDRRRPPGTDRPPRSLTIDSTSERSRESLRRPRTTHRRAVAGPLRPTWATTPAGGASLAWGAWRARRGPGPRRGAATRVSGTGSMLAAASPTTRSGVATTTRSTSRAAPPNGSERPSRPLHVQPRASSAVAIARSGTARPHDPQAAGSCPLCPVPWSGPRYARSRPTPDRCRGCRWPPPRTWSGARKPRNRLRR